ncbi:hypothetical protein D3C79_725290 [compost metagenome]
MNQPQPVFPLAQRRQFEPGIGQAEVQVLAKAPRFHHRRKIAMGRADHLDIHPLPPRRAQRRHFALGQHAQQPGLQVERHIADLVEEQRATVGLLQQPLHALARRPGERPGDIAEQLALDQGFGNGRAVQRDKGPCSALTLLMQLAGEDFLARPGFAEHQHRQVAILHPRGQAQVLLDARILRLTQRGCTPALLWRTDASIQPTPTGQALGRRLVGTTQLIQIEQLTDMLGQPPQTLQQPLPGQAVDRLQTTVGVPRQQVVRLALHVTRRAMGAHHPMALGTVHEERVFDLARGLLDQLADQVLAAAIIR